MCPPCNHACSQSKHCPARLHQHEGGKSIDSDERRYRWSDHAKAIGVAILAGAAFVCIVGALAARLI